MKDIENFCKLFNVIIPVPEHAQYYIDLLHSSGYNKEILTLQSRYEEFESEHSEPFKTKMMYMDQVINYIKETKAFNTFNNSPLVTNALADYGKIEGQNQFKKFAEQSEHYYISFDMAKANYQILKGYDNEDELGISWENLLEDLKIPAIFNKSKPFRQHVFGNLNPNRQQRHQSIIMDKLTKAIAEVNPKGELIFKTHDEIVYLFPSSLNEFGGIAKLDATDLYEKVYGETIYFKPTMYSLDKIGKDKYVKTVHDFYDNSWNSIKPISQEFKGVEGNMFYMYLKKYIIDQDYDERDLLFIQNKRIAKWIDTL